MDLGRDCSSSRYSRPASLLSCFTLGLRGSPPGSENNEIRFPLASPGAKMVIVR